MKKKKIYLLALCGAMLVGCSQSDFDGDVATNVTNQNTSEAINFGGTFRAVTRANAVGADAADMLGNQFIVMGVKGDGTAANAQTTVFDNYTVEWTQNTAGTTESNTKDWEYVGKTNILGTGITAQSIKYWDFSTTAYNFAAFSGGKGNTVVKDDGTSTPSANEILATAISSTNGTYTLRGSAEDLAECYIADIKTVSKSAYKNVVELQFRSLGSKVRMAIYETVPGYSVKNVEFFQDDATRKNTDISTNTNATLFASSSAASPFHAGGTYTVSYPTRGSENASESDYNKAHVAIGNTTGTTATTQGFGTLNYGAAEGSETAGNIYLKRTSQDPSFAGTGTFYKTVLPNEAGSVLEMRVNYTLVSTDGSNEEIKVYGAKAFVPAIYTKWMPNYAYTYIFKISDNTNGWTNPDANEDDSNDPAGLFPITFDAVVLDSEETGKQTTITTVATPSITTYQKGHVYSATNEYAAGDIYAQVMQDNTLVGNLNASGKSYFYELSAAKTEAEVMDALNIRTSGDATTVVGRNGLTLTPATADYTVTAIPGEDGNNITVTAGQAAKLTVAASKTYAYVYDYTTGNPAASDVITAVVLTAAPSDWKASDENIYYSDALCTQKVTTAFAEGTYYKKYSNLNRTYAVKVIKVG